MTKLRALSILFFFPLLACSQTKIDISQLPVLPSGLWYSDSSGKVTSVIIGTGLTLTTNTNGTITISAGASSTPVTFTFFATAGQKTVTLPVTPEKLALVYRNGLLQTLESNTTVKADYTVAGNIITFTNALTLNDIIRVIVN